MESKFTPRSSSRALRSPSHRQVGEIAARRGHTLDQAAGDGGALNAIEAGGQVREDRIDAQPVHGGETGGFHAGGPGFG